MASAETFLSELETKSQGSFDRLSTAYANLVGHEGLSVTDLMKLEVKAVIEQTETAAMWLSDTNDLAYKMALADACGSGARRFDLLRGRLAATGTEPAAFDPLALGYSKLFAFLRSLQTIEERSAAGALGADRFALVRYSLIGAQAQAQGDGETLALFEDALPREERRMIEAGRKALLGAATGEESQARARRASFRVLELLAEIWEPSLSRKFLQRSTRKSAVAPVSAG